MDETSKPGMANDDANDSTRDRKSSISLLDSRALHAHGQSNTMTSSVSCISGFKGRCVDATPAQLLVPLTSTHCMSSLRQHT